MEDEMEDDPPAGTQTALPTVPQPTKPELEKTVTPTQSPTLTPTLAPTTTTTSFITQHIPIQHKPPLNQPPLQPLQVTPLQPAKPPALLTAATSATPLLPSQTQMVTVPSLHPTVITQAPVSHPSVIQAVNHVIQGGAPKPNGHLAPSTTASSVQLAPGHQSISHITVHPVAHLGQHLPALYPQPVAVTQPAVVGHITHTINHLHPQINGTAQSQPTATLISKQTAVGTQMVAHHPQLGQTVFNPVTMVTHFPINSLKLA